MSADAESAYGQPWFQRGANPSEPLPALDTPPAQLKKTAFEPYLTQQHQNDPEQWRFVAPAAGVATGASAGVATATAHPPLTAPAAQGSLGAEAPTALQAMQRRVQQALGDQVTPVRLASHLSVLLVAAAVLLFSRVEIPDWDFQLVAMPAAQPETAGFNSVTSRMAQLLSNPASISAIDEEFQPQIVPFTIIPDRTRQVVQIYTVAAGDTVLGIAGRFGLNPETLQWSNPELESNPDLLSIGDQVKILPLDGALHTVAQGDTLAAIASRYKVDTQQIIAFDTNNLDDINSPLIIGSELVIPGGTRPFVQRQVVGINTQSIATPDNALTGSGNFSWPAAGEISQAYWGGHPAIDIAGRTGAPVRAADGGFVTLAGGGWNGGYGNHVIIDHGNGFATLYAHLNTVIVRAGENVSAGQQIGTLGNTGNSTGPHLHFEIRWQGGARNPYNFLP
jgi:LysM repeat protein